MNDRMGQKAIMAETFQILQKILSHTIKELGKSEKREHKEIYAKTHCNHIFEQQRQVFESSTIGVTPRAQDIFSRIANRLIITKLQTMTPRVSGLYFLSGKNSQPKNLYLTKLSFNNKEETKTFPDKQKPRYFSTIRPARQKVLKGVFQTETKGHQTVTQSRAKR